MFCCHVKRLAVCFLGLHFVLPAEKKNRTFQGARSIVWRSDLRTLRVQAILTMDQWTTKDRSFFPFHFIPFYFILNLI